MFLTVFLIFYFMVIKPQQQVKTRALESLLKELKRGDNVVLLGELWDVSPRWKTIAWSWKSQVM